MPTTLLTPKGKNKAYELLLKREAKIKPASVSFRRNLLNNIQRTNYINEYDRLEGELNSLANVFGKAAIEERIHHRHAELRKLFRETYHEPKHPIHG